MSIVMWPSRIAASSISRRSHAIATSHEVRGSLNASPLLGVLGCLLTCSDLSSAALFAGPVPRRTDLLHWSKQRARGMLDPTDYLEFLDEIDNSDDPITTARELIVEGHAWL